MADRDLGINVHDVRGLSSADGFKLVIYTGLRCCTYSVACTSAEEWGSMDHKECKHEMKVRERVQELHLPSAGGSHFWDEGNAGHERPACSPTQAELIEEQPGCVDDIEAFLAAEIDPDQEHWYDDSDDDSDDEFGTVPYVQLPVFEGTAEFPWTIACVYTVQWCHWPEGPSIKYPLEPVSITGIPPATMHLLNGIVYESILDFKLRFAADPDNRRNT